MKTFTIDEQYITSVTVREEWSMYRGKTELTEEEFVRVLKGTDRCSSVSSPDHPEFAALREKLGAEGYIMIQRGWWNGDVVTKPFKLNGVIFKKSDQFLCGAAMTGYLKSKRKQ